MAGEPETIGQRLRRLRLERGLSQRALAEPGVSYAYISRIEAGTRQPSVKALRKLAPKLGVSADYLETGSDLSESERLELRLADAELRLRLESSPSEAVRDLRSLLDEALAAGDLRSATRARIVLGGAALAAGRATEAIELLEPAAHDDDLLPAGRPDVYFELGRAYAYVGRLDKAISLYDRCLEETREKEPENLSALVRYATALSYALTDAGQLERAQEVLSEIVDDTADALAEPGAQTKLYWSIARLAGLRGEHASSLEYARRALALVEATEDTVELGRAHLLCGYLLVAQGNAGQAASHLDRAEELLGASPRPTDVAYLRTEQAKAALLAQDGPEAERRAREALEILGELDPAEQGAAWLALARGLDLQGDRAAFDAFGRAAEILEGADKLAEAAEAWRAWGRALRAAGREGEAMDVLDRAAELAGAGGRTGASVGRTR